MRHRAASLVMLTLLALVVSGCSRRGGSEPDAFSWTESLPPGSTLHIRDGFGPISVTAVPGSMASIKGGRQWRRGRSRDIEFQVTRSGNGNDVYVCAMWRASGRCDATGYHGKRTEGLLSLFSLFHRTTDATASFVVEVPVGVGVDAKTTNGAVTVDGVRAGVTARTVRGSVTARDVAGRLDLTTTSGNVRFSLGSLDGADTIRASTVNGGVHAELPANTDGSFELHAGNGSVHSDFPIVQSGRAGRNNTFIGRIGSGPRYVRLKAMTGSVSLVRTPATDSVAQR